MKVAVLTTCSRRAGGLFYSVCGLSKALDHQDCKVQVFSPRDTYSQQDLGAWDPLPVELYRPFGPMQSSFKLRHMLRKSEAELIHLHGIWLDSQWAALHHQKRNNVPVVVSPRGMLDPWALKNAAWKKMLIKKLFAENALNEAVCIHALCQAEVDAIRSYGLKNPVALIPNGVVLPETRRQHPEGNAQKPGKTLLFLGRIHPKKGLRELIRAWSGARQSGSNAFDGWKLLIAGWDDGGHEQGLRALVDDMDLGDTVNFIGSQYGNDKEKLLRSVDAFILPSFSEGLPMSVLEAWSYSLPVLITDFCNFKEGFDAEAALRIEPETESITKGLLQLSSMSDDDLYAMGAKGRKLVEERFTWPKIAADMRQVYEWCVTRSGRPECMEV